MAAGFTIRWQDGGQHRVGRKGTARKDVGRCGTGGRGHGMGGDGAAFAKDLKRIDGATKNTEAKGLQLVKDLSELKMQTLLLTLL